MTQIEAIQKELYRQYLILIIRRWLPTPIRPLLDELLGMNK
jgi:hypothetical protein